MVVKILFFIKEYVSLNVFTINNLLYRLKLYINVLITASNVDLLGIYVGVVQKIRHHGAEFLGILGSQVATASALGTADIHLGVSDEVIGKTLADNRTLLHHIHAGRHILPNLLEQ